MFEKEAEEYADTKVKDRKGYNARWELVRNAYLAGAKLGYNKALDEATHNYNAIIADYDKRIADLEKENAELKMQLKEWKKCFLACSSPFCSKHFPTVESSGVLGNMEKKENLKRGTK